MPWYLIDVKYKKKAYYRKTSSRGAYGHDPFFEVFLKNIH